MGGGLGAVGVTRKSVNLLRNPSLLDTKPEEENNIKLN